MVGQVATEQLHVGLPVQTPPVCVAAPLAEDGVEPATGKVPRPAPPAYPLQHSQVHQARQARTQLARDGLLAMSKIEDEQFVYVEGCLCLARGLFQEPAAGGRESSERGRSPRASSRRRRRRSVCRLDALAR